MTVVAFAATKGMLRVLQALVLHHGVDCTREETNPADSPLIAATMFGHVSTVDFLLQQYQARGRLEVAFQRSGLRGEEAKPLMCFVACLDRDMNVGGTTNSVAMARLLVEKWGVRVPRYTDEVNSWFHLAIVSCDIPLMDYFLTASGVSVDARNPCSGQTALHFVCMRLELDDAESLRCARFLVEEKGADPTLLTEGFPASQYAKWQSKSRTHKYLSQCDSSCGGGNSSGQLKKGRKTDKVDRAEQTEASVEAAAEAARQAAARARLAEESLQAELEAEEEAAKQVKIE